MQFYAPINSGFSPLGRLVAQFCLLVTQQHLKTVPKEDDFLWRIPADPTTFTLLIHTTIFATRPWLQHEKKHAAINNRSCIKKVVKS
jgi:hypothetical protein